MLKSRLSKSARIKAESPSKSNERLRAIFSASPDAITITDQKGRIVDCNQIALRMYGAKSKSDLVGKITFNLIAKKDRVRARENRKKTLRQVFTRNEYTLLTKNGVEFLAELSSSATKDASGKKADYVTVVKDITERKKAETTLQESQKKFERLFMRNPEAAFYADSKWRIIDINPRFTELFGYTRDEIRGKRTFDLLVPKSKKQESTLLGKKSKTGYTYCDSVRRKKDRSLIPVSISVAPIRVDKHLVGYVGLYKDITERKKAEKTLSESEERYRSLVDNIGIGVSVISPKMEILSLNKQMKRWFPHVDASKRSTCYKSFNKPSRKSICRHCPTIMTLKDGRVHESITNAPCEGKIKNYRVFSSPIKEKDGKITASVEIFEDITERKRMEEQLKHYSEHLQELVKERTRNLEESEKRFRSLVETAPVVIYTLSADGKITSLNPVFEKITGWPRSKWLGKSFAGLVHPDDLPKASHMLQNILHGVQSQPYQLRILSKSGKQLIGEFLRTPRVENGRIVGELGIAHDITEIKHHEERLSTLSIYGAKLNAANDFNEIFELTLDAMKQTLGFEYACFMIVKKGNLEVACHRGYKRPVLIRLPLDGTKRGVTLKCAKSCKPILVPDVRKNKDYVGAVETIRSELAVPVVIDGNVFGVLNVESKELKAFGEKDAMLLQILASHAATAISSLKKRDEIQKRLIQQASLMKSSTQMIHSSELRPRLQAILDAIQGLGWRRVVLSVRDENLNIAKPQDIVTAGLTDAERKFLWSNRQSGDVWAKRLGPDFDRFRIGEFYYMPWSDPFVRKKFTKGTVQSHLLPGEMVDWNPDDLLYAPLRLADGKIVGVVSMDDPVDGRRPTSESLAPMELFLHQAAVAIENARLIQQLNDANTQIQEYAGKLEVKVTERTRELVEAQNKLLKTERLAAIGELAGMVGHDLRNPLTGIAGATYFLKTKYGSQMEEKGKEMLRIIENDIEYSNKIISDLLDYSRALPLELKENTVDSIVREALAQVKIPKNIEISNLTQHAPWVKVDKEKMKRVFVNVIRNAVDAMPNGGVLEITCKWQDGRMEVAFRDTGGGIKKELMEKLWMPFFTTKAKGMGLGLPVCKRIIEAHRGKIMVESQVGKGTTFTITFPIEQILEGGEKVWVNMPESLLSTTTKA